MASPEDTIVAKLEWSKLAGGYIERWVRDLDLADEWGEGHHDLIHARGHARRSTIRASATESTAFSRHHAAPRVAFTGKW